MKRVVIFVKAAKQGDAHTQTAKVDTTGGAEALSLGYSPQGGDTIPTHYGCGWTMTDRQDTDLRFYLAPLVGSGDVTITVDDGSKPTSLAGVAARMGIKPYWQ